MMNDLEQVTPVPLSAAPPAMRRNVRETTLRVLYAVDAGKRPLEDVLDDSLNASDLDERGKAYLQQLVAEVVKNRAGLDAELDKFAIDFPTHRQAVVDRNILRLAAAEIVLQASDAPPGAVVNEAVELAKKYSTKDSGRFVNGVLGALVRSHTGTEVPEVSPIADDEGEGEDYTPPTHFWGERAEDAPAETLASEPPTPNTQHPTPNPEDTHA